MKLDVEFILAILKPLVSLKSLDEKLENLFMKINYFVILSYKNYF